jgi:hypothetical protein
MSQPTSRPTKAKKPIKSARGPIEGLAIGIAIAMAIGSACAPRPGAKVPVAATPAGESRKVEEATRNIENNILYVDPQFRSEDPNNLQLAARFLGASLEPSAPGAASLVVKVALKPAAGASDANAIAIVSRPATVQELAAQATPVSGDQTQTPPPYSLTARCGIKNKASTCDVIVVLLYMSSDKNSTAQLPMLFRRNGADKPYVLRWVRPEAGALVDPTTMRKLFDFYGKPADGSTPDAAASGADAAAAAPIVPAAPPATALPAAPAPPPTAAAPPDASAAQPAAPIVPAAPPVVASGNASAATAPPPTGQSGQ